MLTVSAVTVLASPDLKSTCRAGILPDACLEHLAEGNVVDLRRIDLGAFDGSGQGDGAEGSG